MLKTLFVLALGAALSISLPTPRAQAQPATMTEKPFLHPMFSENAVLQRDRSLTIWGWAAPNSSVAVKFDGSGQTARADNDGRWSAPLAPHAAGGPHVLEVAGSGRGEYAKRENLLFGEVWLCSGQSNMEWSVNNTNDAVAEKAAANYPQIRLMRVPRLVKTAPLEFASGASWQVTSPATIGNFSAVGYFFGRKLQQELNVPIGLIDSSWGGTPAESWVSDAALQTMGDFDGAIARMKADALDPTPLKARFDAWWQNDPGTKANWQNPDLDDADWKTIAVPGAWENLGYPGFDGVMWFRRDIDVPADWAGRDLELKLGTVDDDNATFWNGTLVGETRGAGNQRNYSVPGALVKAGRNVLVTRVLDTGGSGGFSGSQLSLGLPGSADSISLNGPWKVRPGATLKELPARPGETNQNTATALYNGMIAPLLPGQIKGAIWYQGESNAGRAAQYQKLLPTLIKDWRARFGEPMPFYIVQLANYTEPDEEPRDDAWPRLREAQAMTARDVADVGLAVITDIGEAKDIHPRNKQDVGLRLALAALHQTYGRDVEYSGPILEKSSAINDALQLTFSHAMGLNLKGDSNRVFAVAGADKKFHWATPTVAGDTVTLRSPDVATPQFARFGWSNNPRAALYNEAGLPAAPFRTD